MKRQLRTTAGSVALLLLSGFATPCIWAAAENQESPEVSTLLSNAKTDAYQVREDALTRESYTRSNTPLEVHTSAITQMQEHVNAIGRTDAKLSEAKDKASPSQ